MQRIEAYSKSEIRFNLMALVSPGHTLLTSKNCSDAGAGSQVSTSFQPCILEIYRFLSEACNIVSVSYFVLFRIGEEQGDSSAGGAGAGAGAAGGAGRQHHARGRARAAAAPAAGGASDRQVSLIMWQVACSTVLG